MVAFSVFTLGREEHEATTDDGQQSADNCKGWVAGVEGEDNLHSSDKNGQQAWHQPWSTPKEGHCSLQVFDAACRHGSCALLRLAKISHIPADVPENGSSRVHLRLWVSMLHLPSGLAALDRREPHPNANRPRVDPQAPELRTPRHDRLQRRLWGAQSRA